MKPSPLAAVLALACVQGACREESTPAEPSRPAAIERKHIEAADAMAQFAGELARVIRAYPADCDEMAAALQPLLKRSRGAVDEARALEAELAGDPAAAAWLRHYLDNRTGEDLAAIASGLEQCRDHAGVKDALSGLLVAP